MAPQSNDSNLNLSELFPNGAIKVNVSLSIRWQHQPGVGRTTGTTLTQVVGSPHLIWLAHLTLRTYHWFVDCRMHRKRATKKTKPSTITLDTYIKLMEGVKEQVESGNLSQPFAAAGQGIPELAGRGSLQPTFRLMMADQYTSDDLEKILNLPDDSGWTMARSTLTKARAGTQRHVEEALESLGLSTLKSDYLQGVDFGFDITARRGAAAVNYARALGRHPKAAKGPKSSARKGGRSQDEEGMDEFEEQYGMDEFEEEYSEEEGEQGYMYPEPRMAPPSPADIRSPSHAHAHRMPSHAHATSARHRMPMRSEWHERTKQVRPERRQDSDEGPFGPTGRSPNPRPFVRNQSPQQSRAPHGQRPPQRSQPPQRQRPRSQPPQRPRPPQQLQRPLPPQQPSKSRGFNHPQTSELLTQRESPHRANRGTLPPSLTLCHSPLHSATGGWDGAKLNPTYDLRWFAPGSKELHKGTYGEQGFVTLHRFGAAVAAMDDQATIDFFCKPVDQDGETKDAGTAFLLGVQPQDWVREMLDAATCRAHVKFIRKVVVGVSLPHH